jgi:GNAT superfamily N-acetyltransferase
MPKSDDFAVSFFNTLLADISVRIFIAEENGEALGCIVCKSMERTENPFTYSIRYLLVDQISILPNARGRGVGTALMKKAEALARELDVQKIQLDSWDFNIKAHAFFDLSLEFVAPLARNGTS